MENEGAFTYGPPTARLARSIGELADAYNERPATLIKMTYTMASDRQTPPIQQPLGNG